MPNPPLQIPDIDADAAIEHFMALAAIPGRSGDEAAVADAIVRRLLAAGIDKDCIAFDDAHTKTRQRGNCGNLVVTLPGDDRLPRVLLSAHMDTVPICVGSQPVRDGDRIRSSLATGVGADDRSGCAALLTAALERLGRGGDALPPAALLFTVQEELGLEGARHLDAALVGRVDRAFNFDGGLLERLTNGAIGGERIQIRVQGMAAHAGVCPEKGISAIAIASVAIAELHRRGWLGRIAKNEGTGTANVGVIQGGDATNVVTPEVTIAAEARSHDAAMRQRIVKEIREAFEAAAAEVRNAAGQSGTVEFSSRVDYEAFRLPADHPGIVAADALMRSLGRTPYVDVASGGLDSNWLYLHGFEAVTLGCGQYNLHSVDEYLSVPDYLDACRIATALLTI